MVGAPASVTFYALRIKTTPWTVTVGMASPTGAALMSGFS